MSFAQPPRRWALRGTRVCLPDGVRPATLLIDGERIQSIQSCDDPLDDVWVEDAGGCVVLPGIVDAHVHVNEPGRTEWEGFYTASRAAATGGVTTIVDMPLNSQPVTTTAEALNAKRDAALGKSCVDVYCYGGMVPGNAHNLSGLIDAGALGIKAFMCDSGLEEFPASRELDLRDALQVLQGRGVPLLVHAELPDSQGDSGAHDATHSRSYANYMASRPPSWEENAIRLLIQLSREYNVHVHVVHLATASALPMIREAKQEGVPLTVETCPHYLFWSAEQVGEGQTLFKCAPPIRDDRNRRQLCQALTDGLIDTIGSDHSPCPPELKRMKTGDFFQAWGGISSLQLTLSVVWTLAGEMDWSIDQIMTWLSESPADLLGIADRKGRLAVGNDADFIIFDPDIQWTVKAAELRHRHPLTPYDGSTLRGKVRRTFVRGQLVYQDGMLNEP